MKDMWGKEAKVGDVFVHPLRGSSSVWMNKYEIVEIGIAAAVVKARNLKRDSWVYKKWDGNNLRDMTVEERAKVDAKTVTISTFSSRSTL